MARIGAFCLPETGHLTPTLAVLMALAAHGHDVVVFTVADMEPAVRRAGLGWHPFGAHHYPAGTHARRRAHMGRLNGVAAAAVSCHYSGCYMEAVLADGLRALEAEAVDLVVVDQIDIGAHAVVRRAGLPYVTISLCLIMNADALHPTWAVEPAPDPPHLTPANRRWRALFEYLHAPHRARVDRFLSAHGLPVLGSLEELWSPLAQISQQPEGFEFARPLPPTLHFAGPFANAALRPPADFPWERLTGQPLIYAAFGSLVNGDVERIRAIADACSRSNAQLVLQLDGGAIDDLPGRPVVVPFAPQVELLQRACLMITHAGLNSTLECLTAGVPMVAMPITNDEPGVAARIAWSSTGAVVPTGDRNPARLRETVEEVLSNDRYRRAAGRFREAIARRDGATYAASLIEQAI